MTDEQWPVWRKAEGLQVLARYVSPEAAMAVSLRPPDNFNGGGIDAGMVVLRSTYDALRDRRIRYGHEPWNPGERGQRIRPPASMVNDKGTCLDLSIAFAAMCEMAQLRAMLALTQNHALVIVDTSSTLTDGPTTPDSPLTYDIVHKAFVIDQETPWPDHLVAVDVAQATQDGARGPMSFDEACKEGARHLNQTRGDIRIVDIKHARESNPGPCRALPAPPTKKLAPINTYLPAPASFEDYHSRAAITQALMKTDGIIVLFGESGMGKSALAYKRAVAADFGYGWFVGASDKNTLAAQLAEAERNERPIGTGDEVFDRHALAGRAVARLNGTDAPWVMVMDNANCDPSALKSLMPDVRENQTLIITTTNPAWVKDTDPTGESGEVARPSVTVIHPLWSDRRPVTVVHVGPLEHFDHHDSVLDNLPPKLKDVISSSPLLACGVKAALEHGAEAVGLNTAESGADILWHLARGLLREHPEALTVASALSWLPTTPQPVSRLESLTERHDAASIALLSNTGLVTHDGDNKLFMHRLIQEAIRKDPPPAEQSPVARILRTPGIQSMLIREADGELLAQMEVHLRSLPPAASTGLGQCWHILGRVQEYRLSVPKSAELYGRALDESDALTPEEQSSCWLGRARAINQKQHPAGEELAAALEYIEAAKACVSGGASVEQKLAYYRAVAMDGLLLRKRSHEYESTDPARARELVEESIALLKESRDQRALLLLDRPDLDLDDLDRADFNFGGNYLALAKLAPTEEREKHLDDAEKTYREVLKTRQDRYGDLPLNHIAACTNGLALTYYYRTILTPLPEPSKRKATDTAWLEVKETCTKHLRDAFHWASLALAARQTYEGIYDGGDTAKTNDVMVKILLTRKGLAGNDHPLEKAMESVIDFSAEARWRDLL